MTEYVLGFAFSTDDRTITDLVALIRKDHPQWQAGKLNGIGGHIHSGEEPHRAMVREFNEEAGLYTKVEDWTRYAVLEGADYRVHCFTAGFPWPLLRQVRSMTSEQVILCSMHSVNVMNAIPNLTWLLPMARWGTTKWLQIKEYYHE